METGQGQTPNKKPDRVNLTIGLVALLALGLGVWQIRNLIHLPFATPVPANQNTALAAGATEGADVQALQKRDTDGDGLSDYDELYVYHTSPYLKDTDSDGIDDKTEVTNGTDPNCPAGQTCGPITFKGAQSATTNTSTTATPTAAEIRTLLKNNGATDAQLGKYDDATLLKLYSEVAGTSSSTPTNTSAGAPPTAPTTKLNLTADQKAKLSSMSGAEIRQLLLANGVDKNSLSQFDDATLQALVKQVINQ